MCYIFKELKYKIIQRKYGRFLKSFGAGKDFLSIKQD